MTLVDIIRSPDPAIRNRSVDEFAKQASTPDLLLECAALDQFWRENENLYERVRALFFLYAIYRFHLPERQELRGSGLIPFEATSHLLRRRFEESCEALHRAEKANGLNAALASAFAAAYRGLAFKTLTDQVRRSVRSVRGNQWMSRIGHPMDYPLTIRPELLIRESEGAPYPILKESTPVRMDLSHSGWSDIFLSGHGLSGRCQGSEHFYRSGRARRRFGKSAPSRRGVFPSHRRARFAANQRRSWSNGRHIENPSDELFDFARDYLGLLKAAVIASGLVPPAMEGVVQPISSLLRRLVGEGRGVELVSRVRNIPKGSRLAVSTNLLAGLIAVLHAGYQPNPRTHPGALSEGDRRLAAARAIFRRVVGVVSGGGWQDSGWCRAARASNSFKARSAAAADPGSIGISQRTPLCSAHTVFSNAEISAEARERLQQSLVLVHGGMAQDVGPILEMVTEKYLLRSPAEWQARQKAIGILDEVLGRLRAGDIQRLASETEKNFFGPIQSIIPWASNAYTETLIAQARAQFQSDFWGFWMLGGMAGGGMGFIFSPGSKARAQDCLQSMMAETKEQMEEAVPFAMNPVPFTISRSTNMRHRR